MINPYWMLKDNELLEIYNKGKYEKEGYLYMKKAILGERILVTVTKDKKPLPISFSFDPNQIRKEK